MRISDWSSDVCSSDLALWRSGTDVRRLSDDLHRADLDYRHRAVPLCAGADGEGGAAVEMSVWGRIPDRPISVIPAKAGRSEEHTSELQSLIRISYAVFCLKKKNSNIRWSS